MTPSSTPERNEDPVPEERPPFLGSWRNVHLLLVGVLVLEILVFYGITRYFAPA